VSCCEPATRLLVCCELFMRGVMQVYYLLPSRVCILWVNVCSSTPFLARGESFWTSPNSLPLTLLVVISVINMTRTHTHTLQVLEPHSEAQHKQNGVPQTAIQQVVRPWIKDWLRAQKNAPKNCNWQSTQYACAAHVSAWTLRGEVDLRCWCWFFAGSAHTIFGAGKWR